MQRLDRLVNIYIRMALTLLTELYQMFTPQYSMHGFNWHDQRGKHDIGFTKVLAGISTFKIPGMILTLLTTISHEMKVQILSCSKQVGGTYHDERLEIMKAEIY